VKKQAFILANFGGPRSLEEIEPFLISLLTDQDLIRTNLPDFFHHILFRRIAKNRVKTVEPEYLRMGGKSPIYEQTELWASQLTKVLPGPVLTFHRYLEKTHDAFIRKASVLEADEIRVLPLFPQFTYVTTGSIARFFSEHLPWSIVNKLRWVRSYADHPAFVKISVKQIQNVLDKNKLKAEEVFFLFSAHGVPASYISAGDLYLDECRISVDAVMKAFPNVSHLLAFQSQFGKEEWLRPYTKELVKEPVPWLEGKKTVLFIPISFTSDHIETLQEIGHGYLPEVKRQGFDAHLVPAVGNHADWVDACKDLFFSNSLSNNQMLIRKQGCKTRCSNCRRRCRK